MFFMRDMFLIDAKKVKGLQVDERMSSPQVFLGLDLFKDPVVTGTTRSKMLGRGGNSGWIRYLLRGLF